MNLNLLRFLLNRALGRDTILRTTVLGQPLRVAITARRELRRLRKMYNEEPLVRRIEAHLHRGDVVYDIGANVGLISLVLAKGSADKGCRLHCFEPEPQNFAELCKNIALNDLGDRVEAHAVALGAAEGTVDLFIRGVAGAGCHSIAAKERATHSIQVPLSTVDATARATGQPPSVVKIDVEGAEGQVLAGMEGTIRTGCVREIIFELHDKGDRDRMPGGESIHDWLTARGFILAWETERRREQHRHYRAAGAA